MCRGKMLADASGGQRVLPQDLASEIALLALVEPLERRGQEDGSHPRDANQVDHAVECADLGSRTKRRESCQDGETSGCGPGRGGSWCQASGGSSQGPRPGAWPEEPHQAAQAGVTACVPAISSSHSSLRGSLGWSWGESSRSEDSGIVGRSSTVLITSSWSAIGFLPNVSLSN